MLLVFVSSCSNQESNTLSKEEVKAIYIKKATFFISTQIDKEETILNLSRIELDTITILSSQGLEYAMMNPFIKEVTKQGEYVQKLLDIEKDFATGDIDPVTKNASEKYGKLNDSLQNWSARANKLPLNDTIGNRVMFSCDFNMSDGTSLKDVSVLYLFDNDNDLRKEWNLPNK